MAKSNSTTHENPESDSGIHPTAPQPEEKRESELIATASGVDNIQLTFTMRELCGAVGYGVNPRSFVRDSFDEIANQIEAEGKACDDEAGRWEQLFSIAARARFAGMVADKLNAEVAQ